MSTWVCAVCLKKRILVTHCKVSTLVVSGSQTRPVLVGGRMGTQSTLVRLSTLWILWRLKSALTVTWLIWLRRHLMILSCHWTWRLVFCTVHSSWRVWRLASIALSQLPRRNWLTCAGPLYQSTRRHTNWNWHLWLMPMSWTKIQITMRSSGMCWIRKLMKNQPLSWPVQSLTHLGCHNLQLPLVNASYLICQRLGQSMMTSKSETSLLVSWRKRLFKSKSVSLSQHHVTMTQTMLWRLPRMIRLLTLHQIPTTIWSSTTQLVGLSVGRRQTYKSKGMQKRNKVFALTCSTCLLLITVTMPVWTSDQRASPVRSMVVPHTGIRKRLPFQFT